MDKEIKQIEQYIEEIVGLMEDTADNTRLIEEIQSEVKDLKESTTKDSDFKAEIENIKDLIAKVKTIKGEDGKDGKDGIKGDKGEKGDTGDAGIDGKDGNDGADGSPDTPEEVRDKLQTLQKDKRLDVSAIKGIKKAIKENQTDWSDTINRLLSVASSWGSNGGGTGTVTGTGSTGTLPYWTSASDLSYAPDHTMSVVTGRSYMSMAVWSGNPPLTFSNATGYTAMSQSDGFTTGWSIGQGSSGFLNLNGTGGQGVILDGDGTGYFKTSLQLGNPTTTVTDTDFIIGVSSNTNRGLVIQTKAGTTLPAFAIQNSAGVVKSSFDTTGNGALRVNYSGTMVAAANPGYVLSVQNTGDAGEGSWIEILNSGGYNKGAFFGMYGDQFQLYNWQGGDIEFNTFPTASDSRVRYTITDVGNFGFSALSEYAWGSGWGGGVGVIGIANATTAPTTSLSTTALALYSVSQELYFMSSSNTVRKVATLDKTETFTNKRITKRVGTTTSSATPTPNADTDDIYTVTALAAGATFGAPTGTPTNGQSLLIRIKDNGTARTLAYNAIYRAIGVTLPTTTVISKTLYLGLKYNSADTKWDVLAVGQEA